MRPEDVNPANFTVERIIYNKGNFSIAIGTWNEDETRRFAMRWNEKDSNPDDKGYPSVFQHPMWFQLPNGINNINDIIQTLTANNI
ncbi:hypothetical protein [Flavobacterium sp.]|uniref:hypothetical protein n=1 Tax=Flavobacterium sp. TaxID=239 RepID=UPI00374CAD89